jgi:hypothetical protein
MSADHATSYASVAAFNAALWPLASPSGVSPSGGKFNQRKSVAPAAARVLIFAATLLAAVIGLPPESMSFAPAQKV